MSKGKPVRMILKVKAIIDMDGWDRDVDWSNPEKVVRDQIECVGLDEFLSECKLEAQEVLYWKDGE